MAEEKKAADMPGLTKPIDPTDKIPEHIHEDTLMFKGIDPDTKERIAVNLPALKKEFGEKKALALYGHVARAGKFFDPDREPEYYPDLSLDGLDSNSKKEVDAILKGQN
jgi:hypothetical protein